MLCFSPLANADDGAFQSILPVLHQRFYLLKEGQHYNSIQCGFFMASSVFAALWRLKDLNVVSPRLL